MAAELTCGHSFCISYCNTRSFPKIYETLKNSSLDINHKTCFGFGIIHLVQEPELIGRLLDEGADINMKNPVGYTPLAQAVLIREFDLVAAFLYYGADPSIADNRGYTPLLQAIESILTPAVSLLIEYETDFSRKTIDGDTALTLALKTMPQSITVIVELIKRGSDVSSLVADRKRFFYVVSLGSLDAFKPVWDKFDYKRKYNGDRGLLYTLMIRNKHKMFDYVLRSDKLQNEISAFNNRKEVLDVLRLMKHENIDEGKVIDAIYILLSYGYVPTEEEVTRIYELFGYGDLFNLCVHLDVVLLQEVEYKLWNIIAKLILHPYLEIGDYVDWCFRACPMSYPYAAIKVCMNWYFKTYHKSLIYHTTRDTLAYIRDSRFVNLALSTYKKQEWKKLSADPIPSLLELSRNKARHAICEEYKVKNCRQFYSILEGLELPDGIKDILVLRQPIYTVPD